MDLLTSYLLLALIFTPTLGSLIPLLFERSLIISKAVDYASTLIALATFILAVAFAFLYTGVVTAAVPNVLVNGVQLFAFRCDALGLLFSLAVVVVACLVIWYSNGYMQGQPGRGRFYFSMLFFTGGMLMLVNAANLVVLYIAWEIVGICSFLLVGFWYNEPKRNAGAKKVFFFTHIPGEALLLFSVAAYAWTGSININELLTSTPPAWQMNILLVLVLIAILSKSAQAPFYSWLPSAMQGPTPHAVLLHSAAMVAAGVWLAARLFPLFTGAWLWVLAIIGGFTLILTSTYAIRAQYVKEVLVWSTIADLGFMLLAFSFGPFGLTAGLMQFLAHAFFKSCLFMGAGAVERMAQTLDLNKLGGLSKRMPYTAAAFTIAALSLAAVPPLVGFVSKWLIYSSSLAPTTQGLQIFLVVVLFGSVLSAAYILRVTISVFYGQLPANLARVHEAPRSMWIPQAILATGCVALGIFAKYPLALIAQVPYAAPVTQFADILANIERAGVSSYAPTLAAVLLLTAVLAGLILNEFLTRRPRERVPTSKQLFGAGYELPDGYVYASGNHFLYQVTQPLERLRWLNSDYVYDGLGSAAITLSRRLRRTQSGSVTSYATWIFLWLLVAGAVFLAFRGV
jgi:NADH:ubiquinone oxidoreductase subunit 5 (subunit L)/multisubunit Na+/H+ antiporter MnhA subunit